MRDRVGAVAIGRNEGPRLARCLDTLGPQVGRLVYVDSGSTDGSVETARARGVEVVELDMSRPFSAARARNAGAEALARTGLPEMIQFVDGDCGVEPGWIERAVAALDADPHLGLVTGWRTEDAPDATIYNAMLEVEWHRPAGPIRSCGGDLMVRSALFRQVGGFDPALVVSEDEDFVVRVRATGAGAVRLPAVMTHHDGGVTRFGQWWRRSVRTGHGYAEVGDRHPGHFAAERRRVMVYAVLLPAAMLGAAALGLWWVALAGLALYGLSWVRTARGLHRQGLSGSMAAVQAGFLVLSKLPNLQGMVVHYWRRLRHRPMELIEYR